MTGEAQEAGAAPRAQPVDPAAEVPDHGAPPGETSGEPSHPLHGLGKRFSGGGSTPGDTDERLNTEWDARSSFAGANVHAGTAIGGDQIGDHFYIHSGTGRHRVQFYPLSAEELDEIAGAFAPPDGYATLAAAVLRLRVAVLRGPEGSGRYAVARRLLMETSGRQLFRLHRNTDLTALTAENLQRGAGYLLHAELPAGATTLSAFDLRRLAAELRDGDIRLIIIVPPSMRLNDHDSDGNVLDLGAPATPRDVVRAQLDWRLRDRPDLVRRLLADTAVTALLDAQLQDRVPLARAGAIARWLAEAAEPVEQAAQAVRGRLTADDDEAFERCFEELGDLATQCLAIAVAVFAGEPYETVSDAARLLQERLQPPENKDNTERGRSDPFRASQRRRLEAVRARLVTSDVIMRHGRARGKVVRFLDDRDPYRVLMHVWREYDDIRTNLLGWLRQCARSDMQSMRVRASIATGVLAVEAFDYVRAKVIVPWANASDSHLRYAAAKALQMAAEDAHLRQMVRNLIITWSSEDEEQPELAATAMRAWKVELDAAGPQAAVALFERRAGTRDVDVALAIAESITELLAVGKGAYADDAFALLARWTTGRDRERIAVGVLSFLWACEDLIEQVPTSSGGVVTWPTLLRLAVHDKRHYAAIAALWELALNSAELHEPAANVLDGWARTAEPDPAVRRCLTQLLVAAVRRDRTDGLVRHRARVWADPSFGAAAPQTARELLSTLDEESRSR